MTVGLGFILVIVAAVCLGVAGLLIMIADPTADVMKAFYALLAFGGAFGFVGVKVP